MEKTQYLDSDSILSKPFPISGWAHIILLGSISSNWQIDVRPIGGADSDWQIDGENIPSTEKTVLWMGSEDFDYRINLAGNSAGPTGHVGQIRIQRFLGGKLGGI